MQDIKDLINRSPQQLIASIERAKTTCEERPRPQVMLRLWKTLTETYGSSFVTLYGESPSDAWERQLTGISLDQIVMGLNALSSRDSEFPPNAIEFRKLCLPKTVSPNGCNSGAYVMFEPAKLITDQSVIDRRKKAGRLEINNMRELFK